MVQQNYLSSTWSESPNHLIKLTELSSLIIFNAAYYVLSVSISTAGRVCRGSSETPWAGKWIWPETSLAATETLVCWDEADVHKATARKKKAD